MKALLRSIPALALVAALAGCVVEDEPDAAAGAVAPDGGAGAAAGAQPAQPATPAPQPQTPPDMRLEVDIAARELHVYRGEQRVATHPVAVGSSEWPTPTGEWSVGQVIWNPRWIPPEEEWAEDEEVAEPGDPDNPLGRAQLVYRAPNSIHGTTDEASLGKAVSHGSIRVSNQVALQLARQAAEAGGANKDAAWYRQAEQNTSERYEVNLPNPIPIRVVEGGGGESADTVSGS